MTTFTGAISSLTAGTTTLAAPVNNHRDALKALAESWTAYVPTWTGSGTNPALGNGSFAGSNYARVDKLVIGRIVLTMGTTTTYGTGTWSLTLPVTAAAGIGRQVITGEYRDTSATADYPAWGIMTVSSTAVSLRALPTTAGNPFAQVTPTVPFTWANTDVLTFDFLYEAA